MSRAGRDESVPRPQGARRRRFYRGGMRSLPRRSAATVAALTLLPLLTVLANAAPAGAAGRTVAACDYRVCLYILDPADDTDGDGVTDEDEAALGTDPHDPKSTPRPDVLLDAALGRRLSSFERHATEIVALPETLPDGTGLRTGLGAFDFPHSDTATASMLRDWRTALSRLDANGLDIGAGVTARIPVPHPSSRGLDAMQFVRGGNMMWYADTFDGGSDRPVPQVYSGATVSNEKTTYTPGKGGSSSSETSYRVTYDSGARDEMGAYRSKRPDGSSQGSHTTHYESDGRESGSGYSTSNRDNDGNSSTTWSDQRTDAQGFTTKTEGHATKTTEGGTVTEKATETTTLTNRDGKVVRTTTEERSRVTKDGKVVSESSSSTTKDANGNVTSTKTETKDCQQTTCPDSETTYADPDYLQKVITGADYLVVQGRLDGLRHYNPTASPGTAVAPPKDKSGWIALINPDGVTVVSVGGEPHLRGVQPDYDEQTSQIVGAGGRPKPQPHAGGGTDWPAG